MSLRSAGTADINIDPINELMQADEHFFDRASSPPGIPTIPEVPLTKPGIRSGNIPAPTNLFPIPDMPCTSQTGAFDLPTMQAYVSGYSEQTSSLAQQSSSVETVHGDNNSDGDITISQNSAADEATPDNIISHHSGGNDLNTAISSNQSSEQFEVIEVPPDFKGAK